MNKERMIKSLQGKSEADSILMKNPETKGPSPSGETDSKSPYDLFDKSKK